MKLPLFRTWRANRLIERAMRNSPIPQAPRGLRERLIEQAAEAEVNAAPITGRRSQLVWLAPVAIVSLLLAVWCSTLRHPVQETRVPPVMPKPPSVVKTPPEEAPVVVQQPEEQRIRQARSSGICNPGCYSQGLRPSSKPGAQRIAGPRNPARDYKSRPISEREPVITVSVTREAEPTAGYARVAAYSEDESGRRVRTAWTLEYNPEDGSCTQEMSVHDASGQRQLLTVAVVRSSDQFKGEEL